MGSMYIHGPHNALNCRVLQPVEMQLRRARAVGDHLRFVLNRSEDLRRHELGSGYRGRIPLCYPCRPIDNRAFSASY